MIGSALSHFHITAKLGEGGMGEVYRATDTRLGREVAIKVLPEAVAADPDRLARFEREAQVLASLNHPHIAAIYSIEAAAPTGRPEADPSDVGPIHFLVMELVEGDDLKTRLTRGPLPIREVVTIAMQTTEALAAAHDRQIIHRDLKPANIKIDPDGRVKVLDFGLARRPHRHSDTDADLPTATFDELTRQDQIVGTVPYMSPEQIRAQPLDPRTDLFSLGVLLFELLTRQRPFSGDTSADVISAILREPTPDLESLRTDAPDVLGRLIRDCLEKDPQRRPTSANAVRMRLVEIAESLSSPRRSSDVSGPSDSQPTIELDPRVIAVLPFDNLSGAEEAEFLAIGLHNDLITELSRVAGLTIISRSSVVRYRRSDKSSRQIGRELAAGTLIEGTVQSVGNRVRLTAQLIDAVGDAQRWAERYDRELSTDTLFDLQTEVTRKIVESLQSKLAPTLEIRQTRLQTHDMEAYRLVTLGRVEVERRTESGCRRAIDHFHSATERDPDYAPAWARLAEALAIAVWYGYLEPGDRLDRALQAARLAVELDPGSAEAHGSLGTCFGALRNGPMAMRELNRAVELQPSYWEAHNLLSYLYHLRGQAPESLDSARHAVELNPLSAEAVNHLSLSLLTIGDVEGALTEARRAIELSPGWTTAIFYESLALYELGRYTEAEERLSGLEIEWAGLGARATLALTHLAAGDTSKARSVLAEMDPGVDAFAVGLVHLGFGESDTAFQHFEEAKELTDWACLAVHHWYREIWARIESDPRYAELVQRALATHGFELQKGNST